MAAKQFFFVREGKEFTAMMAEGRVTITVVDPSVSLDTKRPATFLETAVAYQVMAFMYLRNLQQG